MSNINYNFIKEYIENIVPERSRNLMELEDYAHAQKIPIISPEVGQFIKVLLKIIDAKNILEIGTAIGYSSILMAEIAGEDAKITTLERRKDMVKLAKENIKKSNFERKIKIIEGDAKEILPTLEKKYDFIFIDAAKGHYLEFFKKCDKLLKKGGILLSDNVLYKGMVADDKLVVRRKKTIVRRMRAYLKYLSEHKDYKTTVIPLGDGVALSYKESD